MKKNFDISTAPLPWKATNVQGLVRTSVMKIPEGWLVRVADDISSAIGTVVDPSHSWKPEDSAEIGPTPDYGKLLHLSEAGSSVPIGGPAPLDICVNFDRVGFFRPSKAEDNAPSGTRTTISIDGKLIFVRENMQEIAERIVRRV